MSRNEECEEDRVLRSRAEARQSYDRMSAWYDLLSGNAEWRFAERALQLLDPRPGEAVLEIGFGTGRALEWIRRRTGRSGRVVGLDLSEGMRSVAARRLASAGFEDVELHLGDALDLPFPAAEFDGLFMAFTLELFDTPELPGVLAEARRVLRGAGRLSVAALSLRRTGSLPVRLYRWAHRRFPATVDCRPILFERAVERAGFAIRERQEGTMWGLPVDVISADRPLSDTNDIDSG